MATEAVYIQCDQPSAQKSGIGVNQLEIRSSTKVGETCVWLPFSQSFPRKPDVINKADCWLKEVQCKTNVKQCEMFLLVIFCWVDNFITWAKI